MQREHFLLQNNRGKSFNIKSNRHVPWHPLTWNKHTNIFLPCPNTEAPTLPPHFKLYSIGSARQKMCRVTPRQRLIFLWYIQYFTCSTLSGEYICLAFKNVMYCAIHHPLIYWVHLCSMHCTSLPRVRITCQSSVLLLPALGLLQVPVLPWSVQPALLTLLTCIVQHCFFQSRCTISIRLNPKQSMTLIKSNILGKLLSNRKDGTPAGATGTSKAPGSTCLDTGT